MNRWTIVFVVALLLAAAVAIGTPSHADAGKGWAKNCYSAIWC